MAHGHSRNYTTLTDATRKAQAARNMDQSCPVRLKGKAIGNFGLGRLGRRRLFSCDRWSGQQQAAKGKRSERGK